MIIDERYFSYPATRIPGIDTKSDGMPSGQAARIISDINAYIARYEPLFLRSLLGEEVARNICDYPDILPLLAQPDAGTSVIAKYVFFRYSRDNMSFNTPAGEKLKTTENSRGVSPNARLVILWNDMVDECRDIVHKIEDVEICPDFESNIFEKINAFNL